jgi:alpha-galactosidase
MEWKVTIRKEGDKLPGNIEARIYRSRGSTLRISDFEYLDEKLLATESMRMTAGGGRSSQNWLPFFNVDLGDKGIITAIGWSGQWACSLDHVSAGRLRMVAGMEKTHLRLHPGEEIRTPRMMQLFWEEDRLAGHNLLRRFLLEHHTPQINDQPITGPFTIAHWGGMKTQSHLDRIAIYKRERLPMDYLWVDAGWYGLNSTYSPDEHRGDWGRHAGDWRVNLKAHPNGMKPIAAAARDAGMKFMLWVEPERAIKGTLWPQEHPDWFFGEGDQLLLNLGKPEALQGVIELLSGLITEHEVDLYREDFNIDPLDYWRMNEIRCTEGLYAFWDALLARHPGLIIDNCASGGRRIDLETIGRSVALWQSDIQCYPDFDPVGSQVHNMGLNYWLPLHGTGTWSSFQEKEPASTYRVRSTMGPAFQLSNSVKESMPLPEDYPWDWFRRMCADYLRIRPFFIGDYYPLSEPFIYSSQHWAVYQMDRPDLGGGFVMAFRRQDAPWERGRFKLHALEENHDYEVEDADTGASKVWSGRALRQGMEIILTVPSSSALFFYTKKD